jgi:hypothetical protein
LLIDKISSQRHIAAQARIGDVPLRVLRLLVGSVKRSSLKSVCVNRAANEIPRSVVGIYSFFYSRIKFLK